MRSPTGTLSFWIFYKTFWGLLYNLISGKAHLFPYETKEVQCKIYQITGQLEYYQKKSILFERFMFNFFKRSGAISVEEAATWFSEELRHC